MTNYSKNRTKRQEDELQDQHFLNPQCVPFLITKQNNAVVREIGRGRHTQQSRTLNLVSKHRHGPKKTTNTLQTVQQKISQVYATRLRTCDLSSSGAPSVLALARTPQPLTPDNNCQTAFADIKTSNPPFRYRCLLVTNRLVGARTPLLAMTYKCYVQILETK